MQRFRLVFFFLFLAFSVRFEKTRFAGKHRPNSTGTYQHDLCLPAYSSDASLLVGRLAVAIESLGRHSLWPYDDHHDQCSGHFTRLLLTSISNSRETAIRRFLYRVQGLSSLTLSLSLSSKSSCNHSVRITDRIEEIFTSQARTSDFSVRVDARSETREGAGGGGGQGGQGTRKQVTRLSPNETSVVYLSPFVPQYGVCVCVCVSMRNILEGKASSPRHALSAHELANFRRGCQTD